MGSMYLNQKMRCMMQNDDETRNFKGIVHFEIERLFIYYALCSPGREEKRKIDIR